MKTFLSENFLLQNNSAKKFYYDYAKGLPIIDYNSHISTNEIAEDHQFANLTEIWLKGDHYKWRTMRTLGIDETYLPMKADDREKLFPILVIIMPKNFSDYR